MRGNLMTGLAVITVVAAAGAALAAPIPGPSEASQPTLAQSKPDPSALPDIAIVDIGTTGSPDFCAVFTFHNAGTVPISSTITFSFWRLNDGGVFASARHTFNLAVRQRYVWNTCQPIHRYMARFGDEVLVVVDPDNEFAEVTKANNTLQRTIPKPLPRPPALPRP